MGISFLHLSCSCLFYPGFLVGLFYSLLVSFVCFLHLPFISPSGFGQNFSLDWCKQPDVGLPKPDLILFLQLSMSEAAKRGGFGNERYENSSFQEKVLQHFYNLMKDETLNWKVRGRGISWEGARQASEQGPQPGVVQTPSGPTPGCCI